MASSTTHSYAASQQAGKGNSESQKQWHVGMSVCGEQSHSQQRPEFYLGADAVSNNTRESEPCVDDVFHFNKEGDGGSRLGKKTVQWTAGKDDASVLKDTDPSQGGWGDCVHHAPSTQQQESSPRSVPSVVRSMSSPVSAVCRHSHCQMVVRCQVTSHRLPAASETGLSTSCPAAFSPVWTRVLPRATNSSDTANTKGRRRRHTTAGTVNHQLLYQLQKRSQLSGRSRSQSDSELQQLLMKEVGKELKRMSDNFMVSRTNRPLTTVAESWRPNEDTSDDEEIEM